MRVLRSTAVMVLALALTGLASVATSSTPDEDEDRGQRPPPPRDTTTYRGPGAMAAIGRFLTLGLAARPAPSFGLLDPPLQQWTVEINAELLAAIEALWADDGERLTRYRQSEADRNPCDVTLARLKTLQSLLSGCHATAAPRADSAVARAEPPAASDERTRRWLTALERNGLKAIGASAQDDERAVAAYILTEGLDWSQYHRIANRVAALGDAARACAGAAKPAAPARGS